MKNSLSTLFKHGIIYFLENDGTVPMSLFSCNGRVKISNYVHNGNVTLDYEIVLVINEVESLRNVECEVLDEPGCHLML